MLKLIKYTRYIFVSIILLSVISCEKHPFDRFGFDSPFNTNSKALVLMHVDNSYDVIYLEGEINLERGGVEVQFINPANDTVYFSLFESTGVIQINQVIPAMKGVWKLKYSSISGIGSIDLHAGY